MDEPVRQLHPLSSRLDSVIGSGGDRLDQVVPAFVFKRDGWDGGACGVREDQGKSERVPDLFRQPLRRRIDVAAVDARCEG